MNFSILLSKYDITSEFLMLVTSMMLLVTILITRPNKTRMYKTFLFGLHICIIAILLHLNVLYITCRPDSFTKAKFNFFYILYVLAYTTAINTIYAYISLLSYSNRQHIKTLVVRVLCISAVYLFISLYPLFTDQIIVVYRDKSIFFTNWQYTVDLTGTICAIIVFISAIARRKSVAKIVIWGVTIYAPLDILLVILQFHFKKMYLVSYTYVLPFLVFYILFHCSRYDDVIGCQDIDDIQSRMRSLIKRKRDFMIIYITFPQLQNREFSDLTSIVQEGCSIKCRQIERSLKNCHIYAKNNYTYCLLMPISSQKHAEESAKQLRNIISEPFSFRGNEYKACFKQIVITSNYMLSEVDQYISMIGFLSTKLNGQIENEFIIAKTKDYLDFHLNYVVEQAIVDIRAKNDLNDDRVISYIQPIHNVNSNSFRTGEALLRLKLDNELIPPDIVINVAEKNNCIHALSMIMLNKICQMIKRLENEKYDFDAITVNCSTSELADPDFHIELMNIINKNKIQANHIRLEITESTTISNYENILMNMRMLNACGITFYLDDFGTGYSNLERITTFPFSTIKFDKSILYSALTKESSDQLVRMLVNFFKAKNIKLVVEGVEDLHQFDYCKEIGFDYVQGYLFSRPIAAERIVEFFEIKK